MTTAFVQGTLVAYNCCSLAHASTLRPTVLHVQDNGLVCIRGIYRMAFVYIPVIEQ